MRELYPSSAGPAGQLSDTDQAKARSHRQQAVRKLKMARLLAGGEMAEEEREALLQTTQWLGKALAVENRAAEPASLEDAMRPPMAHFWGPTLPALQEFATNTSASANPAVLAIERLLGSA